MFRLGVALPAPRRREPSVNDARFFFRVRSREKPFNISAFPCLSFLPCRRFSLSLCTYLPTYLSIYATFSLFR